MLITIRTHMCKFCTCGILLQFSFSIDITNVTPNNSSILVKQFCHLLLSEPYSFIIQTDFDSRRLVWLIEDYLVLLHLIYLVLYGLNFRHVYSFMVNNVRRYKLFKKYHIFLPKKVPKFQCSRAFTNRKAPNP